MSKGGYEMGTQGTIIEETQNENENNWKMRWQVVLMVLLLSSPLSICCSRRWSFLLLLLSGKSFRVSFECLTNEYDCKGKQGHGWGAGKGIPPGRICVGWRSRQHQVSKGMTTCVWFVFPHGGFAVPTSWWVVFDRLVAIRKTVEQSASAKAIRVQIMNG